MWSSIQQSLKEYNFLNLLANKYLIASATASVIIYLAKHWKNTQNLNLNHSWDERVLPHGPLTRIDPRLYYATGKLPFIDRNMVLYIMEDGKLWIHSAVALNSTEMKKLEKLGTPKYLVVPVMHHRLDAPAYKSRYPEIEVVCPEQIISTVEEVIKVDQCCEDAFSNKSLGISLHHPPLTRFPELTYELTLSDNRRALVVSDAIFNIDSSTVTKWWMKILGAIAGLLGDGKHPRVSLGYRLLGYQSLKALREYWSSLSDYVEEQTKQGAQFIALTVSHGEMVIGDSHLISSTLKSISRRY